MSGIVEIAKKAGVSPATVSRALRGMHHVNERTRKKIVEAAQLLDYPIRPDLLPAGSVERTNMVGVVCPYISRWYFSQAVNGIEQSLREAGMDLLLYNFSQVDARKRVFLQKKLRGKVDGLIVISMPPTDEEFESLLELGIPISLIGLEHAGCSSISIDDVEGGRIAGQYLVDMGHREIAYLGGQRDSSFNFTVSDDRRAGLLEVLEANGIEFNESFEIRGDFDIRTAQLATEGLLSKKKLPTAIFCASDEMAFGAMNAIRRKGLRVPEDISVIGFDDHEIAQYIGLTTIAQQVQFQGQLAASQIMAKIDKPGRENGTMKVPITLVIRDSVAKI